MYFEISVFNRLQIYLGFSGYKRRQHGNWPNYLRTFCWCHTKNSGKFPAILYGRIQTEFRADRLQIFWLSSDYQSKTNDSFNLTLSSSSSFSGFYDSRRRFCSQRRNRSSKHLHWKCFSGWKLLPETRLSRSSLHGEQW